MTKYYQDNFCHFELCVIDRVKKQIYVPRKVHARALYSELHDIFDDHDWMIEQLPVCMYARNLIRAINGWEFVNPENVEDYG